MSKQNPVVYRVNKAIEDSRGGSAQSSMFLALCDILDNIEDRLDRLEGKTDGN